LLGYLHRAYLDEADAGALIAALPGIMPDDSKPRPPKPVRIGLTKDDPTGRARGKATHRPDDGEAFLPDPSGRHAHDTSSDGESFGEEFVASATGGEPVNMDAADEVSDDEDGGPFRGLDATGKTGEDDAEATWNGAGAASSPRYRSEGSGRRSLPR